MKQIVTYSCTVVPPRIQITKLNHQAKPLVDSIRSFAVHQSLVQIAVVVPLGLSQ